MLSYRPVGFHAGFTDRAFSYMDQLVTSGVLEQLILCLYSWGTSSLFTIHFTHNTVAEPKAKFQFLQPTLTQK